MENTSNLFKKIRDTKGTFHGEKGKIKDRNGKDLTEAEDIQKRQQEYTELYKKDLNDLDNHNGVVTHLEPDILECEVKWALRSINMNKASGSDGIQAELCKILKDYVIKVLYSICQQIWKNQQWPQDQKSQLAFQSQRRAMPKNVQTTHNYIHFACQQGNAQTPSSQASTTYELRSSRYMYMYKRKNDKVNGANVSGESGKCYLRVPCTSLAIF